MTYQILKRLNILTSEPQCTLELREKDDDCTFSFYTRIGHIYHRVSGRQRHKQWNFLSASRGKRLTFIRWRRRRGEGDRKEEKEKKDLIRKNQFFFHAYGGNLHKRGFVFFGAKKKKKKRKSLINHHRICVFLGLIQIYIKRTLLPSPPPSHTTSSSEPTVSSFTIIIVLLLARQAARVFRKKLFLQCYY